MANQASIQAHINYGYGRAAAYLGASTSQYRPTDPQNPLGNQIGTLMADFDVDPKFSHSKPSKYNNPLFYGMFDATSVQVGDYLAAPMGTFFVATFEPNKPPLCVECNTTITAVRPQALAPSPSFYGGDQQVGFTPLLSGWPASVLQAYRGERGEVRLPSDTRMPWFAILLPVFSGVTLEAADKVTDAVGRTYTLSSCELTSLGWRLTAELNET